MRIAIDGYNLAMPQGTGVATYGYVLANMIRTLGHEVDAVFGIDAGGKATNREVLFFERLGRGSPALKASDKARIASAIATAIQPKMLLPVPNGGMVERRPFADQIPQLERLWTLPHMFEIARTLFQLTSRFLTIRLPNPPDVMHWTYPVPVRMAGCPNIYTLHDLVPLKLPYATLDDKRYYHRLVAECVRSADHICTVSEASRADILQFLNADPDKVTNTYQASPPPKLSDDPAEDAAIVRGLFGLEPGSYFLFFGALDPKKNISRMLDAILMAQSSRPLVVVTARDWGMSADSRLAVAADSSRSSNGQRLKRRIIPLDFQRRWLLFRLIRGARAILFPSLYEGFGLPALEGMQLGTPVISSNVSSLPEVIGDAGLLINPYDTTAIAGAIRALDMDDALHERLSRDAITQAQRFDTGTYRSRLSSLYSRVIAGSATKVLP